MLTKSYTIFSIVLGLEIVGDYLVPIPFVFALLFAFFVPWLSFKQVTQLMAIEMVFSEAKLVNFFSMLNTMLGLPWWILLVQIAGSYIGGLAICIPLVYANSLLYRKIFRKLYARCKVAW